MNLRKFEREINKAEGSVLELADIYIPSYSGYYDLFELVNKSNCTLDVLENCLDWSKHLHPQWDEIRSKVREHFNERRQEVKNFNFLKNYGKLSINDQDDFKESLVEGITTPEVLFKTNLKLRNLPSFGIPFLAPNLKSTEVTIYGPLHPYFSPECDCGKEKHGFMNHVKGCPKEGK